VANSSPDPEFQRRIEELDKQIPSPQQRAERVWRVISINDPELTTWDVLCFCAEFVALTCERYQWMMPLAKKFISLVYSAHYYDEHRTNDKFDRVTREVESLDSSGRPNAGPKSLFDLTRASPASVGIERSDTSTPATLHVSDNQGGPKETSGPSDAGTSDGGDAHKPS
jgi:hypothetical protein